MGLQAWRPAPAQPTPPCPLSRTQADVLPTAGAPVGLLSSLWLAECEIGAEGGRALAAAIDRLPASTRGPSATEPLLIYLHGNPMGREAAAELLGASDRKARVFVYAADVTATAEALARKRRMSTGGGPKEPQQPVPLTPALLGMTKMPAFKPKDEI